MRINLLVFRRAMVALVVITTARFFSAAAFGADESPIRIPEGFRGTWLLRLTSDDGGKTAPLSRPSLTPVTSQSGRKP